MNSGLLQSTEPNVTTRAARLHYVDWLRVLAMFGMRLKKKQKVA